jgi:hypothetical protein
VDLCSPPGQQPVLLHERLAPLLDGLVVVVRQVLERERPVGIHVEEVPRRFLLPAGRAPEIRIDRVLDD